MADIFVDGKEIDIQDLIVRDIDLTKKVSPRNLTYDQTKGKGIILFDLPSRVSWFPIKVPVGQTIQVSMSSLTSDKCQSGYYFTNVDKVNIDNSLVYMSNWIADSTYSIKIPNGAKYIGFTVGYQDISKPLSLTDLSKLIKFTATLHMSNLELLKCSLEG